MFTLTVGEKRGVLSVGGERETVPLWLYAYAAGYAYFDIFLAGALCAFFLIGDHSVSLMEPLHFLASD